MSGGVCGRGSFFSVSFCVPSVSLMSQCALLVSPRVRWFFVLRCWRAIFSHFPDFLALRDLSVAARQRAREQVLPFFTHVFSSQ